MLDLLRKFLAFRIGQTTTRGMARMVGLGRLSMIIGLIGGLRALRSRRHA